MNILNQLCELYLKLKGDSVTKIYRYLLLAGLTLSGGGVIPILLNLKKNEKIWFSVSINDASWSVTVVGILLIVVSTIKLLNRADELKKKNKSAFVFFPGFQNMSKQPPTYLLPNNGFGAKEITFELFDTYNPGLIIDKFPFFLQKIRERTDHNNSEEVLIFALGSVPFLYIVGTFFRDAHSKIVVCDYDRVKSKWIRLKPFAKSKQLVGLDCQTTANDNIKKIVPNKLRQIGLALSFTFPIHREVLPDTLKFHTAILTLDEPEDYDALVCESVQQEIVKKIQHKISVLAQRAEEVHLFVSAQASVAINLGRLYQNGSSGTVVIHCYSADKKCYDWALKYYNDTVSRYYLREL